VLLDAQLAAAVRTDPVAEITKDGPDKVAKNWANATPDKRGKVIDRLMTVTVNKAPRGSKGFKHELIGIDWKGRSR
jgi:site-specific DNA recombinase